MRSFKELILLGDMNVNYVVKDDQNEIKSVISSHGIEELIKQPTRFDLAHKTSTLIDIRSVIRQKGESQNGCFKKTKHAKFSEKRTFLTP